MTTIYGAPVSPYVRKVLISLDLKGVAYELKPITPLDIPDGYEEVSPLRKIPALVDEQLTVSDSTVICEYLDERYPEPYLRPKDLALRARCRWFEEYADTRMVEAMGPPIFWERVVKPLFLQQEPDKERVQDALDNLIPPVFDYLESQVPGASFLFEGRLTLGDIAIASVLLNARYGNVTVDASSHPKLAAYVDFILGQDAFVKRQEAEKEILGT